ncbi:MAG TPA: hypothetical protein VFU13_11620 [Steroidobacteraceae bacterium]|nr:hypothetical protein [Steroidobacteraceae bacterium]
MAIRLSTAFTSLFGVLLCAASANASAEAMRCKAVRADVQEVVTSENCTSPLNFCTRGTIDGNHGLDGTTFFSVEGGAATPPTSPGIRSYSGVFTITTELGQLFLRETGVTYPRPGNPEGGVLSSIIEVTSGTGRYEGATGIMFFHGRSLNGTFDVEMTGTLCTARRWHDFQ